MALPNANKSIHGIDEVGTKFVSVGEDDQGKAMTNFKNYLLKKNNIFFYLFDDCI